MPKRIGHLWEKQISIENCIAAELEMTRHKKNNSMADRIKNNSEKYGAALSKLLSDGDYQFHPTRNIIISDSYKGKKRQLQIPTLEDQAAQQTWLIIAIPHLIRRGYYYSCSSIPKAGTRRANHAIIKFLSGKNPPAWGGTTDIVQFYATVPHWVVSRGLRKIFKDERFIRFACLCMTAMSPSGVGLAIGWPISPWLANIALTEIDYLLKQYFPEVKTVRYADDIAFLGRSFRQVRRAISFLSDELLHRSMKLKQTWSIHQNNKAGVSFLSYRFFPGYTILNKKLMYRISRKMRRCKTNLSIHNARSVISYMGIIKGFNSYNFRVKHVYPYVNPDKCRRMISCEDNRLRKFRKCG